MRRHERIATALLALMVSDCAGAPPPKPAPVSQTTESKALPVVVEAAPLPKEPALVPLRVGALAPVENAPIDLRAIARREVGAYEIIEFALPAFQTLSQGAEPRTGPAWISSLAWHSAVAALDPAEVGYAFVGGDGAPALAAGPSVSRANEASGAPRLEVPRLWIRRLKSARPVSGVLYTAANPFPGVPGHRVPFRVDPNATLTTVPDLERAWARALATRFQDSGGPFFQFAAARLRERYLAERPAPGGQARGRVQSGSELLGLMDTLTGRLSIQEALQRDRGLYSALARQKATLPIAQLQAPRMSSHPWSEMRKALAPESPAEPLARATPAEFYFVRAKDFGAFLELLRVVEEWGEPAADALDGRAQERGTFARYEVELGLERSGLTEVFGPQIVAELAIVGSDPYVHEGTDLTLLFHVRNADLFHSALAATLAKHAARHGGVTPSTYVEDGVSVSVERSRDGRVRRQRATLGDIEVISNSPAAIKRVIATAHGKHPRLAEEPDFDYMLTRDASVPNDVLGYMGDKFVASVVGPQQKIAEARRQLALLELSTPGYAALLSGFIAGQSPKTRAEVLSSRLLVGSDLVHADGTPIEWQPGQAARSKWGTPAALEPLLDLPRVTRVSPAERTSYAAFASQYEGIWSERIDPIALRVTARHVGQLSTVSADLRVLPLLRSEYGETLGQVGSARLLVPKLESGARAVLGIGKQAELRRALTQLSHAFGGSEKLGFDWLGDYAFVGVANRNELANAARKAWSDELELPEADAPSRGTQKLDSELLADFPIYAGVSVRSRLGAVVALTALREVVGQAAPGAAVWSTAGSYRNQELVKVAIAEAGQSAAIYYTLTPDAWVLALNEAVLRSAIDQVLDVPPKLVTGQAPDTSQAAQLVFELAGDKASAVYRTLGWLAVAKSPSASDESWQLAEAVFYGAPEVAREPARAEELMRNTFGSVARTGHGRAFTFGPDGVRDPDRGTPHAPIWPQEPVPGSPIDKVLSRLAHFRTALSFDQEPFVSPAGPLRSLHARVDIELRP